MGCCVSSTKSFNSASKLDRNSAAAAVRIFGPLTDDGSREPPSSMEEETVKEMLSETPSLKPTSPKKKDGPLEENEAQQPVGDEFKKKLHEIPINGIAEQASEFCEFFHPNESLSVSAATFTDQMDGGGEVHQKVLESSPVKLLKNQPIYGEVEFKREISPNRTLTRRSDQSPVRRNGAVGSVRMAHNRDVSPAMARRGSRAEPPRRDPDENPGRRSRSPGNVRSGSAGSRSTQGRTVSVRKSGKSTPNGAVTAASEQVAEENNSSIERKCNTQIESLENPLVSLECFIFL